MAKLITYTMRYAHSDSDTPGSLRMLASNDRLAITEARQFCLNGYRNQTWANVALSTGQTYACRNVHGEVVSRMLSAEQAT